MTNKTKIVFIGATSMSFGLSMLRDIFSSDELRGSTLTLVGRNAATLAKMTELAKLLNTKTGAGLIIEQTTDRRAAFDGAGFVVNATAIDRNRLWKLDWEVPRKYGIRHTLGENGGPGGLFFTLRTLPLVFDFVREMQELCPQALFLNFSNPESRIILALGKYSPIRALGLCHGIFMGQGDVARIMGLPYEQVEVWGAGLNHSQCLLQIRHRTTGEDLYPLLRAKEKDFDPSFAPLTRRLFRAFGYWMTCSDDHLGEYLAYGWEGGEHGYDFAADERGRAEFGNALDRVLAGAPVPADWLTPSGERGAAAIGGILHNKKQVLESGIVLNRGAIRTCRRCGGRGAGDGGRRRHSSDLARSSARPHRQTARHASERAAARGRGRDACLQGDCAAGAADRSRGEFRVGRGQTARRIVGSESSVSALHLNGRIFTRRSSQRH